MRPPELNQTLRICGRSVLELDERTLQTHNLHNCIRQGAKARPDILHSAEDPRFDARTARLMIMARVRALLYRIDHSAVCEEKDESA